MFFFLSICFLKVFNLHLTSELGCLSCRLCHSLRFTYYVLLFLLVFPFVVCSLPRSIWANCSVSLSASCRYSLLGIAQLEEWLAVGMESSNVEVLTVNKAASTSYISHEEAVINIPKINLAVVSSTERKPGGRGGKWKILLKNTVEIISGKNVVL